MTVVQIVALIVGAVLLLALFGGFAFLLLFSDLGENEPTVPTSSSKGTDSDG